MVNRSLHLFLLLLWSVSSSMGFITAPSRFPIGARKNFASKIDDDAGLKSASDFMIDHFWLPLTPTSLTGAQRATLLDTQIADFEGRYGRLLGKRKLNSALLAQRDGDANIEVEMNKYIQCGPDQAIISVPVSLLEPS